MEWCNRYNQIDQTFCFAARHRKVLQLRGLLIVTALTSRLIAERVGFLLRSTPNDLRDAPDGNHTTLRRFDKRSPLCQKADNFDLVLFEEGNLLKVDQVIMRAGPFLIQPQNF